MTEPNRENQHWSIDKRIPLLLIAILLTQSATAIWWGASFSSKTEQRLEYLENMYAVAATSEGRIIRLEQIVITQSQTLDRIESKIDRVVERERSRTE